MPDQALLPSAAIDRDRVTVHNIRRCVYYTTQDYVVDHHDKTFDLGKLSTVDFIVVPFAQIPVLAHTMLSFGFDDGDYLAVSVEVRKEEGETFSAWKGGLRQFEIMYVVGDERDLIKLRTHYRKDDVYLYRARADRRQVRALFLDVMHRVNKLANEPEFCDTLTNNCTTNIAQHVNGLKRDRVPFGWGVLLPGLSDRMAHRLDLLDTNLPFPEAKRAARISELALTDTGTGNFSAMIRQNQRLMWR